ncbi:MAG: hypothetical protein KJ749_12010 [Planctomycetes bacterium]|nr:hypothetical protein [Planctomycetota bacterium]
MRRTIDGGWVGLTVLIVLFPALAGCTPRIGPEGQARLTASSNPYEPDLPLPEGFRLVDRASEDWASAALRYVRHQYEGRSDKYTVRQFYREQMPLVRWVGRSESNVLGRYTLTFERGKEDCVITIGDAASGRRGRVEVVLVVTPKG